MHVLFCGYRDWALTTLANVKSLVPDVDFALVSNPEEMAAALAKGEKPDLILCVGWSWILPPSLVDSIPTVGIHPSDLPAYAGGSPIQHQILDGITDTRASLFRLTSKLDRGPILAKAPLSLEGRLSEVFDELASVSSRLICGFLRDYPASLERTVLAESDFQEGPRKRLLPKDSELTFEKISKMNCRELYDFIRCHEDPYPNAYFEDETGKVLIKCAEFEPKKRD